MSLTVSSPRHRRTREVVPPDRPNLLDDEEVIKSSHLAIDDNKIEKKQTDAVDR